MRVDVDFAEITASPAKIGRATPALIDKLLPRGAATAELREEGNPRLLLPRERQQMRSAGSQRLREFAAGRHCARQALASLGIAAAPIDIGADRKPRWPRHFTGSITHTHGFTAAAAGMRGQFQAIGIDAERIGRVSREIWNYVFLAAKSDWLEDQPADEQGTFATLMFSAKEAFFKCQYEITGQWLEFRDVGLHLTRGNRDGGEFSVTPVGRVELFERDIGAATVLYARNDDLAITAMTIPAGADQCDCRDRDAIFGPQTYPAGFPASEPAQHALHDILS